MLINGLIVVFGIVPPWVPLHRRAILFEWLPLQFARLRWMPFSAAVPAVLIVAGIFAALAVLLRVAGAAYLGPGTVTHPDMKAVSVVANGPYRYVRNPLYIGIWCMVAAMALLMPPSGAMVSLGLLAIFLVRLTLGEEAFLSASLGNSYRTYSLAVPRFLPRLRSNVSRGSANPQWIRALLAELTPISVLIGVGVLACNYSVSLMGRIILVGFGLSLITRALQPLREPAASA
jgi:protein-S-isoprenylcysteine O-methyltransferase Ste14